MKYWLTALRVSRSRPVCAAARLLQASTKRPKLALFCHLSCCVSSWANTLFTHTERLQLLLNKRWGLMTFSPFSLSRWSLFPKCNIFPLRQLLRQKLPIIAYRFIKYGIYIKCIDSEHITNNNNTRFFLRNNILPAVRRNYFRFTTLFSGIAIRNSSFEIKSSHNVHAFSTRSNKYFF